MRVETLLNKCHPLKSFVYSKASFCSEEPNHLHVEVVPRKNSRPVCGHCGRKCSVYDHRSRRKFKFIPFWGFQVFLIYAMRRVHCKDCGIKTEAVAWSEGKSELTLAFALFLAKWAKRLSWKETAEMFGTSWHHVFESVRHVVEYGLKHRRLEGITAIGIDEWQRGKGQDYVTLVYQINQGCRRLLYVAPKPEMKSLIGFFQMLGSDLTSQIQYICSDMWKPYLSVIAKKAPQALHILDRFHIVANLQKALNEVRASEARKLKTEGYEDVLKHTKYCFLKKPENLTDKQRVKLKDVLQYDLKSVRAYLLKESFQLLWTYSSPQWAGWFLDKWCRRASSSRLEPFRKFAKSMRKHRPLIMNYFRARKAFSSGVVEGLNRKINLATRKAYGFRSDECLKIALFHTMGELPEPKITHRFF